MSTIASAGLVKFNCFCALVTHDITWHYMTLHDITWHCVTPRDNQPSRHESSERHLLNANNDPDMDTVNLRIHERRIEQLLWSKLMQNVWTKNRDPCHFNLFILCQKHRSPASSQISILLLLQDIHCHPLPSIAIHALLSILLRAEKVRYRGEMFR